MLALAWDARPIGDGDRFVSSQLRLAVVPLVADDVPGSLTVDRPVALVVPERPVIEVRATEVRPELLGKPDRLVVGERIALRVSG